MDIARELGVAMRTGEVIIGSKRTIKACMHGRAKMVIIAMNCPEDIRRSIEYYCKLSKIPIYEYPGTSWDLGSLCRKPFMVAALAIIDPGNSDILALVQTEEE